MEALAEPGREDLRRRWHQAVNRVLRVVAAKSAAGLLVLAMVGCGVAEPENWELPPPVGATEALEIVVAEWADRLPGAGHLTVDELPPVRWFAGPCLVYPGDDGCVRGAYVWAMGDAEIHLATTMPLHKTSVAHEVLHWTLDEVTGDSDDVHDSKLWNSHHLPDIAAALDAAGL